MFKAFSLIELMVTIAIIAVLSAVAVPSYKSYMLKAKISSALGILQAIHSVVLEQYDKGILGNTISFGGATITNSTGGALNVANVPYAVYHANSGIPYLTCVFISGLEGMSAASGSAYVAPTTSSAGTRSAICIQNSLTSGVHRLLCGIWTTDPNNGANGYLPPEHLPSGCNCTNLMNNSCY